MPAYSSASAAVLPPPRLASRLGEPLRRRAATSVWLAVAASCLSPRVYAQQSLEREVQFVRAMVMEMHFLGLARGEVTRLQRTFRNASDQERLAHLDLQVRLAGNRLQRDRVLQRATYEFVIGKCREALRQSRDEQVLREARATLAGASQEFGQFLIEELEIARDEAPERVRKLEDEAEQVFAIGIEACDEILTAQRTELGNDEGKAIDFRVQWLRKGVLMREQTRVRRSDRELRIEHAIAHLEALVLEGGCEESELSLRAFFEVAQCREVAGDFKSAVESYTGTITSMATALADAQAGKLDIPVATQERLFEMLQEIYAHAGDALFELRDTAGSDALFRQFHEHVRQFGAQGEEFAVVDARFGHLTLLAECRHIAASGDPSKVDRALALVRRIHDEHPADHVAFKAKALLRGILAARSAPRGKNPGDGK